MGTCLKGVLLCLFLFVPALVFGDDSQSSDFPIFEPPHPVRAGQQEVHILLEKIIPDFDKYFRQLIDHLERIEVKPVNGKTVVDIELLPDSFDFPLQYIRHTLNGEPYLVRLQKRCHLEISMRKDDIVIDKIEGFTLFVRIPMVPDGVRLQKIVLDTATENVSITARTLGGLFRVVGRADARERRFEGVDWWATLVKNLPYLIGAATFTIR